MKNTRNTTAKTAILELIKISEVASSHSEIQKLNEGLCDRVTIYRILDCWVAEDVIHKITTSVGTVKYASCHHNHEIITHTITYI